jgi:hypothetical protein
MKPSLVHFMCVTVFAAGVTTGLLAAQTAQPFEGLVHPPMEPHRNADGSIRRLSHGLAYSHRGLG